MRMQPFAKIKVKPASSQREPLIWFLITLLNLTACRTDPGNNDQNEFFTSGSREADQRASQKMAQADQLAGPGQDDVHTTEVKAGPREKAATNLAVKAEGKVTLFSRLGGQPGISNVVTDFFPRALNDPRVNWTREGVSHFRLFSRQKAKAWEATPENVAELKTHLVQFLSLATGGPSQYGGADIKSSHAGMLITNPEFDAVIGDLKATLDRLQIPDREQKELLAIVESTRPQIVTER